MKKFLSLILSAAMILSAGIVSFAAGDIYEVDEDGDLVSAGSTLIPGTTYYIHIKDYVKNMSDDEIPTKLKLEYEGSDYATDKKVSVLSSGNLSVSRRKFNGDYAYFAAMKLKSISSSAYKDKEIVLDIKSAELYFKDGQSEDFSNEIAGSYDIEYDDCYEITKKPTVISLDDTKDTYDIENKKATLEIDSTGVKTDMVISCDTSYDMSFGEKYMNASLDFYDFDGATARKAMVLTIPKESYKYVYERTQSGLVDVTKVSDGNFIIRTSKLGSYVLSDVALASNTAAVPPASTTPSVSTPPAATPPASTPSVPSSAPGTQGPTGGSIPYNPGTGASL